MKLKLRCGLEAGVSTWQRKLKMGSSTAPTDPVRSRAKCFRRPAVCAGSSQKCGPVRFILNRPGCSNQNVRGPNRRVVGRPRPALSEQDAVGGTFGFDEHLREGRMEGVGAMRRKRQFEVTGELDLPAASRSIRNR